jgi:hypothetical protein
MSLLREIQAAVMDNMRRLRSTVTWLAVVIALSAGNSAAEDTTKLYYPADALSKLSGLHGAGVANAAKDISSKWMFIEDSFQKAGGNPSDAFEQGMNANALVLKNAAAKPDDPASIAIVNDVLADLSIKTEHINSVTQVSAFAYSEVTIEVRTKTSDGREVNGYFIGFSPNHKSGDKDPMFSFNNPTSPSSGSLPPGRYEMTVTLNNQIVQRQQVSIGIQGQGNTITCVVP